MRPHDMGVLFDECAERGSPTITHLDRPLDIEPDGGTVYRVDMLAALVRRASGWLAAAGARRGDHVAIVKDNHWDYDLLACAAIRLGAVPALISGHLPGETLEILLKRLDVGVLLTNRRILRSGGDLASMARRTVCLDSPERGAVPLDDLRGTKPPSPLRRADDDPLIVNHTSGTTGVPKLVVHSTSTIIRRLASVEALPWPVVGLRCSDTVVSASSFAHGRTFSWTASTFCRAPRRVVIVSDHDPARAGAMLRQHLPTVVEALPATFVRWQRMASEPSSPFSKVRLFVSTYDAMHPPTVRTFLRASGRFHPLWMQGLGQTETGPVSFRFLTRRSVNKQESPHPTTRDLGRPLPGGPPVRIVDPTSLRPLPRGRTGLMVVRSKARCLGYVGELDRWQAKVSGVWWNTGDLGRVTRSGRVFFLDREVDALPGLSCVEIEDVIEDRVPGVVECVVLGTPGSNPVPALVTDGATVDPAAWQAATADLPPLAEPVTLSWDDVPRTGTGKVRRLELRTMLFGRTETHGTGRWT